MKRKTTPPATYPDPPAHLCERAKRLWQAAMPRQRAWSEGRLAALQHALELLGMLDHAEALLKQEGLSVVTKRTGVAHLNPLAKHCLELRKEFSKDWRALHLGFDPSIDGRMV
ncbi:hypothetical protein AYO44_03785 [Planctomycetaceae bacterium SCGC AG-212-F19]|nr:hypothetical protein AYO44_03785 [Planctomycetaceae bacterium SCGC AG-212-F19]